MIKIKFDFCVSKCFGTAGLLYLAMLFSASALNAQDLSDDISNPDQFTIGSGSLVQNIFNSVVESDLSTGVTGNAAADIDFFTFNVQPGFQLDSISLDSFSGGGQAFFGFAENQLGGNTGIAAQQAAFTSSALGFTLVDSGDLGSQFSDLAAALGTPASDFVGFDPTQPLDAGTYAFVFQNTGSNVNDYSLTFTGSAVPEPSSALAIVGMGMGMIVRRRRR